MRERRAEPAAGGTLVRASGRVRQVDDPVSTAALGNDTVHGMTVSASWSPELVDAAHGLASRLQLHGAAPHTAALEDWAQISGRPKTGIPPWLPSFLSTFALCGAGLLLRDSPSDEWGVYFAFLTPDRYQEEIVGWIADLPAFGFYAFALGADGDLWIATSENGPSGEVYLLESTSWDGSQPTVENGLVRRFENLAALLVQLSLIEEE